MDEQVESFLAHYGKKGMKWGVINEDKPSKGVSKDVDAINKIKAKDPKAVAKAAAELNVFAEKNGGGSAAMRAKYGPDETPEVDDRNFYQRNKKAIHIGAGVVAVGLVAYGGYKVNDVRNTKAAAEIDKLVRAEEELFRKKRVSRDMWEQSPEGRAAIAKELAEGRVAGEFQRKSKLSNQQLLASYNEKKLKSLSGDFDENGLPDTPFSLKAGSIVKRISTKDEFSIRKNGFFASHDDDDVSRYKAILPTYWKQWGLNQDSGYVVNLKANKDVSAPSRREAFNIYKDMLTNDPEFRSTVDPRGYYKNDTPEYLARDTYRRMTESWIDDKNPSVSRYFGEVKKRGYNALVDENDAGKLAKNPMRYLDGSIFTLEPSNRLSAREIAETQISEAEKIKK